jgi:signal transduction histidine kinase
MPWPRLLRFPDPSLAQAFALAGGLVMVLAGMVVGFFVADRIEQTVVRNAANTTALYMQSFVAPLVQHLGPQQELPPDDLAAIENLLQGTPLGQRIVTFKVWAKGGLVIGASDPGLVGQTFEAAEDLRRAWGGEVQASFNHLGEDENKAESSLNVPLLEIYVPVRSVASGQIICVVEFYEVASQLQADLTRTLLLSWGVVLAVALLVGLSLFAIVLRGSRTIQAQVAELTDLSQRNIALRRRVQDGASRFAGMTDQALRRIGADLHDGPAQQIGFVALRLDALRRQVGNIPAAQAEIDAIGQAVHEAITEIRTVSRGLSLPDIGRKPLTVLVRGLVDAHAARTHEEVRLTVRLDRDPPAAVKTVVCRTVQEGLTNGWRHGQGAAQSVDLGLTGSRLVVAVRDRGPGPGQAAVTLDGMTGLGLPGLQGRAEALGGTVTLRAREDGPGAELVLELDLDEVPG